jgi:hypothetical protein
MSQMSAATFEVLRARRKETPDEINHTDLLRALMRRADRECEQLRMACRANDKLNERFQSLNAELDRLCDVVQPSEREAGGNRRTANPDGERAAACGYGFNGSHAEETDEGHEHIARQSGTREELGRKSHGYSGDGDGPRAKQEVSSGWSGY